jgi:phosphohistidine phosphatase
MELYIVRHGDAVDRADPGMTSDEMRPLTEAGRSETTLMAGMLGKLGVKPELLLTSPLVRARQTAEIIAELLGPKRGATVSDELAPGGSLAGVLNNLLSTGRPAQVVLTGHMPSVGELVGLLVWNQRECGIAFRTAGVARVDLPDDAPFPGNGQLRWLMPPRVAGRLLGR